MNKMIYRVERLVRHALCKAMDATLWRKICTEQAVISMTKVCLNKGLISIFVSNNNSNSKNNIVIVYLSNFNKILLFHFLQQCERKGTFYLSVWSF